MEHGEQKKEKPSDPKTWVRPVEPRRRHRYAGEDPFAHLYESGPMEPGRYRDLGCRGRSPTRVRLEYERDYYG